MSISCRDSLEVNEGDILIPIAFMADLIDPHVGLDRFPFPPFVKTKRGGEWALSDGGKKWLMERIESQYESIQGPQGVSAVESRDRQKEKRGEWKKRLTQAYMDNWPNFQWSEVVGPNASEEDLEKARKVSLHFP